MNVSVIGTGYVGLVTGVCLAEKGHNVVCVDVDPKKIDGINNGQPPIFEAGLEELLQRNIHAKLTATTDLEKAVQGTELSLIAVGTPFDGREIDLTYIKEVSGQIGRALLAKSGYHLVVMKSTVVPGTTDGIVLPILEEASRKKVGVDFGLGMNPEFLTEGEAVHDFMYPDRIVIGGIDEASIRLQEALYSVFPAVKLLRTNNKTAEMIKYASNCLLATMISFSNELANLCTALSSIDIVDVMKGVHASRYLTTILPNGNRVTAPITCFLMAGCGFGGSCLPKDVKTLVAQGDEERTTMRLLNAVMRINDERPDRVIALLKKHFPSLNGVRIAILGLAFRPDTNDMRESPAIPIIKRLLDEGVILKAYDPVAMEEARKLFSERSLTLCVRLEDSLDDVDAIVLVTNWAQFGALPQLLKSRGTQPLVVDGRRLLDKRSVARYEGIGL